MSYCITPGCLAPHNLDSAQYCLSCGSKLWLKERYRPLQPIGSGGFGRTFLAVDEDIPSKPRCVIKQFYIQGASSLVARKAAELFHQEATRLDELGKHPQIPNLLAHFEQNRQLYLVQELIPGKTLMQELQQNGVYNEAQILALLQDLLPVLQYVHTHQVIHRDIKPANIIRREPDGKLILIDFGVAKLITNTALLHTGTIVGSPEYMAPEQIKGKAFPATDLYSLGVTCIHLLTEVSPFDMFDSMNDCWMWRDFLPLQKQVSNRLGNILDKLLQGTVKNRYQSADAVLQDLNSTPVATRTPMRRTASRDLASEVGVDYTKLQNLLQRKKWKEADQQTWDVLCQAIGQPPGYYLKNGDIERLPCEDLLTIDRLWLKHSGGRFGFSVQKRIFHDAGEDYPSFCDRVGWPIHNPLVLESMLKFNLRAPLGHLPSRRWVGGYYWWRHAGVLATKLEQCGIN
ncbi:MAG TPA: serine/threonine-protein kinase [Allocoleopsis sp.]